MNTLLQKPYLQHLNSIAHEGKVVVIATDSDGKLWYTVKQDGFEDSYLITPAANRTGWEAWKELAFPNEQDDPSVVDQEKQELTYQTDPNTFILRSRYRTKDESAAAPVQLVSALGHVYVFRQSKSNTLLVDRFVLDGMTNFLNRKIEVRFKRSKQKHQPIKSMKKVSGELQDEDSLDFRDANGNFFFEPTTELSLVKNLHAGWFSVVLVPTMEHDVYRWHIFAYNSQEQKVELTTIRASEEGLFTVKDYTVYDASTPRQLSGIIKRTINIDGVMITNGLAATKYDAQQEQVTQSGESQLLKTATRLMLAIPTDKGTAAFSFAISADGTLAELSEDSTTTTDIRSKQREVLLPLNTLDEIKAFGNTTPAPKGIIQGFANETTAKRSQVFVNLRAADGTAAVLENGDVVKITGTSPYRGLHRVARMDGETFDIDLPPTDGLGAWEKQDETDGGLTFDGMITAYERTSDGKLRVTCKDHGLNQGDEVQIVGTDTYDGTYPVRKIDDTHFVIERKWAAGEAVKVNLFSRKRRGLVLDGVGSYVEIPHSEAVNFAADQDFTVELWIKPEPLQPGGGYWRDILSKRSTDKNRGMSYEISYRIEEKNLRVTLSGGGKYAFRETKPIDDENFHHIALVMKKGIGLSVYIDGDIGGISNLFEEDWTGKSTTNGPLYLGASEALVKGHIPLSFKGQMSELRIWNIARTAEDIKNNMSLPLTGRETGLAGYWRLGAIADQKVIDFSVHGNDGTVHGDAYISATTLNRKLKDGTEVVTYSNPELFAVSQGATYEESFEFKVNAQSSAVANVSDIFTFTFAYWGKRSRSSEERVTIDSSLVSPNPLLEDLGNGWHRASATVIIPDGVSLLRSFEIEITNVQGEWNSLEVRKHRIRLLSNRISQSLATNTVTLETLTDNSGLLGDTLKGLETREQQEAILSREKKILERNLDSLKDLPKAGDDLKAAKIRVNSLTDTVASSKSAYETELANPLNYWCRITSAYSPDRSWTHASSSIDTVVVLLNGDGGERQFWKFVKITEDQYRIESRYDPSKACYGFPLLNIIVLPTENSSLLQLWKITKRGDSYSFTLPLFSPHEYCSYTFVEAFPTVRLSSDNLSGSLWKIEPIGDEKTNDNINVAKSTWERNQAELNTAKLEWARLDNIVKNGMTNQGKWQTRLTQVNTEIKRLQDELKTLNETFIGNVPTSPQSHGMPPLRTANRGLFTHAALLPFVQPTSRLNALATCEGNVQLSYFDSQGRMRQTNYDATADSNNAAFEQWLPDGFCVCLNFNKMQSVNLAQPLSLTEDWTIEAWFYYPLPETNGDNTLIRGPDIEIQSIHHIMVRDQKLGAFLRTDFIDSGFDMTQLSDGWHHLTAVGQGLTTRFYIDGSKVGDTKAAAENKANAYLETAKADQIKLNSATPPATESAKADAAKTVENAQMKVNNLKNVELKPKHPIHYIGNSPMRGGERPFGKVAEVRIWGLALSDEEIAVNSKTLLSGNEPGLLAYYPFDEATGTSVRDRTGKAKDGEVKGAAKWWACSAPIGNVGHRVMKFDDGAAGYIEFPYSRALNSGQFTASCWVKVTGGQGTYRSVITSRSDAPTRGYIIYAGDNNKWQFWVGNNTQGAWVKCIGPEAALHRWTHIAAIYDGSKLNLYIDGILVGSAAGQYSLNLNAPLRIGAGASERTSPRYFFSGQIAEVSIWDKACTAEEIRAAMHTRLAGKEPNLVAYYPLDAVDVDQKAADLAGINRGTVTKASTVYDNTLPIGSDALVCNEYSTVTKEKVAIMRRFLGYPARDGAALLPDKRIEALELRWIGNAQFAPTLLGYIEGAPPVPSENLTMADDYNGAASVELTTSEDVEFKWTRTQDAGLGATIDAFLGGGGEMSIITTVLGVGTSIETSAKVGFKGNLDFSYQFQNETSISSSSTRRMTDKLELRGTPEEMAKFPHLGNRFIPKNVGYALVVSALADVFITRLVRSRKMIGYQVQPVEGIPPDVNTITFMMNPVYTMNGSLDGLTGSSATSDRFFKHVPGMRAQYGSLYPASYYRLKEAYELKHAIEAEDKRRESYFANFDVRSIDEWSLERNIDSGAAPSPIAVKPKEGTPNSPPGDGQKDPQAEQFTKDAETGAQKTGTAAKAKQAEIQKQIDDLEKRSHATASFAGWQKKMEDLQIRASKRNIVNNYVWDADGGLRTESESFANTVEHSIGGSFSLNAGLGAEAEFEAGISVELTAQATVNMTQTMTKTETRSKGLELGVELGGLEFRGITDYKDNPIQPGEKVDRYRFMSFFLEGSDKNFQDFFSYVVDPEWLASNDEEARALRQAQSGKTNKAWRVLHRVTYVERPALMGFGRSSRTMTAAESTDYQLLVDKISGLETKLDDLIRKLGDGK